MTQGRQIYKRFSIFLKNKTCSIPSFDIYGLVVMLFAIVSGIRGYAGLSQAYLALNEYAIIWHTALIMMPLLYIIGQLVKPPNGLILTMIGTGGMIVGSIAVYVGLSLAMDSWWFSGFATLLIFGFGSLGKFVQTFYQLNKLRERLNAINGGS